MAKWISAPYTGALALPDKPGCYAIYVRGALLYIGSAVNLRTRFRCHQIEAGEINRKGFAGLPSEVVVKYKLSSRFGDWAMLELRLIRRLKPRLNSQHKRGGYRCR